MDISRIGGLSGAFSTALTGLQQSSAQAAAAAENIAAGSLDPVDVVAVNLASLSFKANAEVLKTSDEMTRQLLDIKA